MMLICLIAGDTHFGKVVSVLSPLQRYKFSLFNEKYLMERCFDTCTYPVSHNFLNH